MFSYRFFLLEQLSTSIMKAPTHSLNARWNKTKPNTYNSLYRKSKVSNSSLYVVSHRNSMYIIEFWVLQKIMFTFYVPVSIWVGTRVPWLQRASQEQTLGITAQLFSLFEKGIFFLCEHSWSMSFWRFSSFSLTIPILDACNTVSSLCVNSENRNSGIRFVHQTTLPTTSPSHPPNRTVIETFKFHLFSFLSCYCLRQGPIMCSLCFIWGPGYESICMASFINSSLILEMTLVGR